MADFHELLIRTSRTFGLAIPLLGEPCRRDLTLAYLLFRVTDTLEDADALPPSERVQALTELRECLQGPDADRARQLADHWVRSRPSRNSHYMELLSEFPALLAALGELDASARDIILRHGGRTAEMMATFVVRSDSDGNLTLSTLDDLRQYCYAVAGIVGEMITEIFLARHDKLRRVNSELQAHARLFGEGLQLVNILKDADEDSQRGRRYLPSTVPRQQVFDLAREDLVHADQYIMALRRGGADRSVVSFTELPVQLARRTLDRVEQQGAGAKLTRTEVAEILGEVDPRFRGPHKLPPSFAGLSNTEGRE